MFLVGLKAGIAPLDVAVEQPPNFVDPYILAVANFPAANFVAPTFVTPIACPAAGRLSARRLRVLLPRPPVSDPSTKFLLRVLHAFQRQAHELNMPWRRCILTDTGVVYR